ncbi:MAG: hypothetical protein ACI4WH_05190 [Oscillospiraceae bacterium]
MKTLVQYPALRSNIELNGYTVPETVTKLYSSSFFMRDVSSSIDNNVSITIPCDADIETVTDYYFGHTKDGIQEYCNYDSFTIDNSAIDTNINCWINSYVY